jgi:chitodextrinase
MKMKRIISVITAVAMIATLSTGTVFAHSNGGSDKGNGFSSKQTKEFKDMKGHWGYNSVQKMQKYGIFNGYDDGSFKPDNTLSEAELAVLIERIVDYKLGEDANSAANAIVLNYMNTGSYGGYGNYGNGWGSGYNWGSWGGWGTWSNPYFNSVPAWAQQAVWCGAYNNYLNPNTFNPNLQTNRVTAIVAIAKALGLEPETVYSYNPFTDGKLIADEDLGYVLAMYNEGYISGYPDGSFNPNATLTRAQMATIIEKLLEDGINLDDEDTDADEDAPTWASGSKVEAVAIRDDGVDLKWTAAKDDVKVTGYKVLYEVNDVDKVKLVTGKTTTISGLKPDTEYTFTVEARDAAGNWSDDGPSVDIVTDDEDEDTDEDTEAPSWDNDSEITVKDVTTDTVELKWDAADDNVAVTKYKVIYELDGVEKTKTVTGRTATISGLDPNTEYTFTVEARDAAGNWSDDGPSVDVKTEKKAEADKTAPTWDDDNDLTVSPGSSGATVTLIWPDAEDNVGVTAYKIYKNGQLIYTADDDKNSYIVSGLAEDTEYTFKVKAVDAAGNVSGDISETYEYTK